jgi:hypothetical protein
MCKLISDLGANDASNNDRGYTPTDRDAVCHVSTKRTVTRALIPLLWLLLSFAFVTQTVKAQDDPPFQTGDGSAGDPFQITSVDELAQLATLVNAGNATYNAANYKLMNNLDLNVAP